MQLTYLEAIRQGIWEEMERDPLVFCIGEDIGIYGGAFKVTDGFIDRFGADRVIDTPIAESAIVGAAFGASLTGMRPVAEFQFMDFIGCAFNQISNMVAKTHYLWGAPAPLVLRGPLERESLRLAVLDLRDPARRLGWLADHLDELPGSGIIYTLTVAASTDRRRRSRTSWSRLLDGSRTDPAVIGV